MPVAVEIEYFSHYKREFIREAHVILPERVRVRCTDPFGTLDWDQVFRAVYRKLKSDDAAQNNFYVLVRLPTGKKLLDLSNGKQVEPFEVTRVLRFPRKKKKK